MPADPSPARRLTALALSDQGFVFDPRTGHSYTANPTALALLEALREGLSPAEAEARLRERFAAEGHEVGDDVAEFARLLREYGLLPPATGKGPW